MVDQQNNSRQIRYPFHRSFSTFLVICGFLSAWAGKNIEIPPPIWFHYYSFLSIIIVGFFYRWHTLRLEWVAQNWGDHMRLAYEKKVIGIIQIALGLQAVVGAIVHPDTSTRIVISVLLFFGFINIRAYRRILRKSDDVSETEQNDFSQQ